MDNIAKVYKSWTASNAMSPRIFQESERLNNIVSGNDWLLYDITDYLNKRIPTSWEELNERKPDNLFIIGSHYLFVPKPSNGHTLRATYAITKGLGPSIWVPSLEDHADMNGSGAILIDDNLVYLFTRLIFEGNRLIATSPQFTQMPYPPTLEIAYRSIIEKFEKFFKITTSKDFDRPYINGSKLN